MTKSNLSLEQLEQRLSLLGQLVRSLREAQQAIVRSDRALLEQETSNQAQLCAEWRILESAAGAANPSGGKSYRQIEQQSREIELRLRHLLRVHAALLRGAQESLGVMANLLLRAEGTYEAREATERLLGGRKETMQCRI